jgi:hypothetical protein
MADAKDPPERYAVNRKKNQSSYDREISDRHFVGRIES